MFIRAVTKDSEGRPDLCAIAQQYRAEMQARTPLYQQVAHEGRQQTAVRKAVQRAGLSGRSLLVSNRELLRKAQRLEAIALHVLLKGKAFKDEVMHFASSFGCCERLQKLVQEGKAVARLRNRDVVEGDGEAASVLDTYEQRFGQAEVSKLKQMIPVLSPVPISVAAHTHCTCYELELDYVQERAVKACGYFSAHKETNLGAALDSVWSKFHRSVEQQEDEQRREPEQQTTACYQAGFCSCTPEGARVMKMKNQLLRILKETFNTKEQVTLLQSGFIVLAFTSGAIEKALHGVTWQEFKQQYFHVAHLSLKPYRTTLQKVIDIPPKEHEQDGSYIYVQVSMSCEKETSPPKIQPFLFPLWMTKRDMHFFLLRKWIPSELDPTLAWTIDFLELVCTTGPVLDAVPECVAIRPWCEQKQFWPLVVKARGKRGKSGDPWAAVAGANTTI
eukprot:6490543-Amphidinium_carterae.2